MHRALAHYFVHQKYELLMVTLFALSYLFPISQAIIADYRFSEHSSPFSYYLNYPRLAVMVIAVLYFRTLFKGRVYLKPLMVTSAMVLLIGIAMPASVMAFELATLHTPFVWWMLLQLQTVITEGIIFFILIPRLIHQKNIFLIALIFALAHGINLFFPLVLVVGVWYTWVLQRYNFLTHIAAHYGFNFLHLLLFTYPHAG